MSAWELLEQIRTTALRLADNVQDQSIAENIRRAAREISLDTIPALQEALQQGFASEPSPGRRDLFDIHTALNELRHLPWAELYPDPLRKIVALGIELDHLRLNVNTTQSIGGVLHQGSLLQVPGQEDMLMVFYPSGQPPVREQGQPEQPRKYYLAVARREGSGTRLEQPDFVPRAIRPEAGFDGNPAPVLSGPLNYEELYLAVNAVLGPKEAAPCQRANLLHSLARFADEREHKDKHAPSCRG